MCERGALLTIVAVGRWGLGRNEVLLRLGELIHPVAAGTHPRVRSIAWAQLHGRPVLYGQLTGGPRG